MKLSIIIPTIPGRAESLERTLRAYHETMPRDAEILVEHGHPTVADAWNAGAARAEGEILHLTADDLCPETGWWESALQTIEAGALPAPIVVHPSAGQEFPPAGEVHEPGLRDWSAVPATVIPTVPASLWREIGPIPSIHYYSDNLISARAHRLGWQARVRAGYRFVHHLEHVGRDAMVARAVDDGAVFHSEVGGYATGQCRVLLTGGAGFIGTHLRAELANNGYQVIVTDRHDGDLTDPEVIRAHIETHRPDVVVHLAASPGRVFGEECPGRTITQNVTITANVARACAAAGVRLVYASTSEAYGALGEGLRSEASGYDAVPNNLYGLSKRWGEEAAALYAPHGLQVLRISMPYGPGLPAGRGRNALHNFIWWASHGERIRVHSGAHRSWCWVGDTARAIRTIITHGEQAESAESIREGAGVYNVGRHDAEVSMLTVARMACDLTGASRDLIDVVDPGPIVSPVKRLDCSALMALGWAPRVDLDQGMRNTMAAARDYPAVW